MGTMRDQCAATLTRGIVVQTYLTHFIHVCTRSQKDADGFHVA